MYAMVAYLEMGYHRRIGPRRVFSRQRRLERLQERPLAAQEHSDLTREHRRQYRWLALHRLAGGNQRGTRRWK